MNGTAATRLPPQIIHVPPPERVDGRGTVLVAMLVFVPVAVGVVILIAVNPLAGFFFVPAILLLAGLLVYVSCVARKHHRRVRERMLRQYPGIESDPVVVALQTLWLEPLSWPDGPAKVRGEFAAAGIPEPPGPRIVCMGLLDIPQVGELHFEPYLITATELLWGRLAWLTPALSLLIIWGLEALDMIPAFAASTVARYAHPLSWVVFLLLVGVGVVAPWVWRAGIRATYVRLVPGLIQIIQHHVWRRRPSVYSYPMEAGTLVIVRTSDEDAQPTQIVLSRGTQRHALPLNEMKDREATMEHIWWAMLSTAPIPQMDDADLLSGLVPLGR